MRVSAILAAGGRGARFGAQQPKQLLLLGGRAILQRSLDAFLQSDRVDDIVVALPPELLAAPPEYLRTASKPVHVVAGGERRQDSVANAFALVQDHADVVVIHDAARPFVSPSLIARTIDAAIADGAAIAALAARDTVKRRDVDGMIADTLPREEIFLAQTPQAFRTDVLRDALSLSTASVEATDEATLAEQAGHRVRLVEGDPRNLKITTPADLRMAEALAGAEAVPGVRIGNGYDLHRLVAGRPLVLGGVTIPFEKGLEGHSDADAVCHAITDAILGAAGLGDIGRHFPDDDPVWKNANSMELLRRAWLMARNAGFRIVNVDAVIIAEKPKLSPYADQMIANLAAVLESGRDRISIKGKTNEGVDSIGAGESIAVHVVALLSRALSSMQSA